MLLPSRSLLPLLLVILQFFAPLLHAHTAQRNPHFGLHIPGLEAYGDPAGGVVASQPETCCAATADCIVAVDDGYREKTSLSAPGPTNSGNLPLLAEFFGIASMPALRAEFPQLSLPPARHRSPSPAAPRAPPAV